MSRDQSLMQRIHAGDVTALDELLQQYWHPLVGYAAAVLSDRDAAEDVVQEAILQIWTRRSHWTPSSELRGFLYRVTRNRALTHQASEAARARRQTTVAHEPRAPMSTPLQVMEEAMLRDQVEAALNTLPPRRREVFVLARYHGHTYREIAQIMEVSPQTVANQMSAALEHIRNSVRPPAGSSLP